jgi:hypothetical protein
MYNWGKDVGRFEPRFAWMVHQWSPFRIVSDYSKTRRQNTEWVTKNTRVLLNRKCFIK